MMRSLLRLVSAALLGLSIVTAAPNQPTTVKRQVFPAPKIEKPPAGSTLTAGQSFQFEFTDPGLNPNHVDVQLNGPTTGHVADLIYDLGNVYQTPGAPAGTFESTFTVPAQAGAGPYNLTVYEYLTASSKQPANHVTEQVQVQKAS